jgi:NADPH2:quinone reductase
VGSLAVQLGKAFGAGRVIATASSEDKRARALELGADVAVDVSAEDLSTALREANDGRKVDVVLEMAGGRVFEERLLALAPFGRLVAYGVSSREQVPVTNGKLMKNSQAVVGFYLGHCVGRRDMMDEPLAELFEMAAAGRLEPQVGETYPLSDVRRLHEDLQERRTTGKLLVDPAA